jgi:hypothetical protein
VLRQVGNISLIGPELIWGNKCGSGVAQPQCGVAEGKVRLSRLQFGNMWRTHMMEPHFKMAEKNGALRFIQAE